MNNKIIENIHQQTKRLVDQLHELEVYRQELTEEQYNELKQSTSADLQTFKAFLENLQKGDEILASEIEKSKKQLIQAIKESYNKEQIMSSLYQKRVTAVRANIQSLDKQFQLKKLSEIDYNQKKRHFLIQIQETGTQLSQQQKTWLQLHHFNDSKGEKVSQKAEKQHMSIAQQGIKKLE